MENVFDIPYFPVSRAVFSIWKSGLNYIWKMYLILLIFLYVVQSFPYENCCECCKNLASRSSTMLFTLSYFFFLYMHSLFFWKIKICSDRCFRHQIRLQTTVQWYILRDYSSARIGFNIINKCHTLPIVYSMLVKIY